MLAAVLACAAAYGEAAVAYVGAFDPSSQQARIGGRTGASANRTAAARLKAERFLGGMSARQYLRLVAVGVLLVYGSRPRYRCSLAVMRPRGAVALAGIGGAANRAARTANGRPRGLIVPLRGLRSPTRCRVITVARAAAKRRPQACFAGTPSLVKARRRRRAGIAGRSARSAGSAVGLVRGHESTSRWPARSRPGSSWLRAVLSRELGGGASAGVHDVAGLCARSVPRLPAAPRMRVTRVGGSPTAKESSFGTRSRLFEDARAVAKSSRGRRARR